MTRAGAIASVVAMGATWSLLFYKGMIARPEGAVGDYLVAGMMPVTIIFAASTAALVIVSLATSPPPRDVVDRYFMKTSA